MSELRKSFLVAGFVVLLLAAVTPSQALAQGADRPLGIGGKAAWNLSRVRGEAVTDAGELIDFGTGSGYAFGGLLSFAAGANVTIQPEFLYSRKQIAADLRLDGIDAEGEIDTDWFEIPVIAKLHGQRARGARPFALVGGTISFLVNAEQSVEAMGMTATQDIKDELIGTDLGLTVGGGVDFLQDWGTFTLDARYSFGLRRLGADAEDDVKQDTFSISGGFIF